MAHRHPSSRRITGVRPSWTALTAAALACLIAAAPLLPERQSERPPVRSTGQTATMTATAGTVDATKRAEIDRVVAAGLRQPRLAPGAPAARLAASQVRCAEFEGLRYCLGQGWTDATETEVQARVARAAAAAPARVGGQTASGVETTGDLSAADDLRQRAAMSADERARAEKAELTQAARSVAKVMLLRHEVEGRPLPADFAARHPEAGLSETDVDDAIQLSAAKTWADYPQRSKLGSPSRTREQERSYWCGPATMQMIGWAWKRRVSQTTWANRLGTTRSGSSISRLVAATNRYTGWDRADRAGTYITLDISGYSYARWWLLMMRHIEDYRAPVILHPLLHKEWYPYLDDDASGHFQMGRGYNKRGSKPNRLSYFEPWNQQRFDPSEPFIERVQFRRAYPQYRANLAHFQHNVGV